MNNCAMWRAEEGGANHRSVLHRSRTHVACQAVVRSGGGTSGVRTMLRGWTLSAAATPGAGLTSAAMTAAPGDGA